MMRNKQRDRQITRELEQANWNVIRIWEHALVEPEKVMMRLKKALQRI